MKTKDISKLSVTRVSPCDQCTNVNSSICSDCQDFSHFHQKQASFSVGVNLFAHIMQTTKKKTKVKKNRDKVNKAKKKAAKIARKNSRR